MAEEDIIFGKNRHLFGGIEPSNMTRFLAERVAHSDKVIITTILPSDTVINGQVLCTVAGAVIRKSTTEYPKDEFDGELVANIASSQTIEDAGTGDIYYAAFPYSDQGVYNRSDANRAFVKDPTSGIYGYDLDTADPDPATRVTYPDDCDNYYYQAAAMDKTSGVFDYGDWPSEAGDIFMPKPCMLKYDGTVDYYLDPNDYSKKEDGTSSDISNTAYGGNAMMEWPKIYTKRWEDEDGIYHFRCSLTNPDDTYECWCNYDKNNNEIDHFYTSIYECIKVGSVARSLSGGKKLDNFNYNTSSNNYVSTLILTAYDNGDDWTNEVLSDRLLITDLLVMMCKTTNGQAAIGSGVAHTSSSDTVTNTGTMNNRGLFYYDVGTKAVKVFGMEHWWGNNGRLISGIAGTTGTNGLSLYVKFTRGTKDGSANTDYYFKASNGNYAKRAEGHKQITTLTGSGYMTAFICTDAGRIPDGRIEGSSTTYECDYTSIAGWSSKYKLLAIVGFNGAGQGGPFEYRISIKEDSNDQQPGVGVGLSCKPSAT